MVIYFTLMVNNQRNINLTLVTWKSYSDSKAFFYDTLFYPLYTYFIHFYNLQNFCLDHILQKEPKILIISLKFWNDFKQLGCS